MSRRKDVHIPKVWEVEEVSDDDDEDIEEMQKEVEDILSKVTNKNKKKTSSVNQATPLHFDIKVEVEEYDEQSCDRSNQKKQSPSTSKNQLTNNTESENLNSICNKKITRSQTKIRKPNEIPIQQSFLIQAPTGVPLESNLNTQESQSSLKPKVKSVIKHNTYLKCKNYPPTSESIEQNKLTNPSLYQGFDLKTNDVASTMQHLSRYGNVADYYIHLLLRNDDNMPTALVKSNTEAALQRVLAVWRDWFLEDTENRGPPLLYKCKVCGWAWWHLHSFREHYKNVHYRQVSRLRFEFEATNGESYVAMKMTQFQMASEVRIVNAPCWRCGMLPGVKYKSFDTTTLLYHCKCGHKFSTCYEYRLHLDMCDKESSTKKLVNYKCYLCFLRFDTPLELNNHRILSHTVRSDIPAPWSSKRRCKTCLTPCYYGVHDCPTVKRTVPCSYCTKKFSNETVMKLHQSFAKENVKCRLCDHVLQRQCMELMHLVEHTDNYILLQKCTMCEDNKYFYNDSAYNIHLLGKHPFSEEPAVKIPVPVKCLQNSGYNVKYLAIDKIVIPQPLKGNDCDSLKRKAAQKESPRKRRKTINDIIDKNTTTTDASNIKVEDQSIEEFINTENEINEMILLKNKENNTIVKIKIENFDEGIIRAEETIVNDKISSDVNCNKNNSVTTKNNENDNNAKDENSLSSKNENKNSNTVVKIKTEQIEEDNNQTRENESSIANQHYADLKDNHKTIKTSEKDSSVNNVMCLPTNNDKKNTERIENDLQTSESCIVPEKENLDSEMSKEVANNEADNNEMLDFELHIEKNKINLDGTCDETNKIITNTTAKLRIDDNCKTEGNTSNKLIHTHEPPEKNNVSSKVLEKETHKSSEFENVPSNKEDDIRLKENEWLVNQKELNVNINEDVFGNKVINNSEEKDLQYDKEIPNVTSTNYNVPDIENHNSKQVDCPGPITKTIKEEQENFMEISGNNAIKEEILDDDTDDEKLVIAEFNDLIRDKSVKLEVKEELEDCFEDDMIVWGSSLPNDTDNNEHVNLDIQNQGTSSDFLVWTPHLGVVGGDINGEMENDSDDDDDNLSLLDVKKRKRRSYMCRRCKFKGKHREYIEHKKFCVRQNKCEKKFNPLKCDSYKCTACGTQYPTLNKYLKHLPTHSYKPLQCPQCLIITPTKSKLLQHVLYHVNKNFVPIRGILSATKSGVSKMQCTECSTEVKTREFFFHWEQHLPAQRQERDKPIKMEEFAPDSPILRELIALLLERCSSDGPAENKKLRWCKMCSRPFSRHNECKRHYIEHLLDDAFAHITDAQGLRCQICGDVWQKPAEFRLHIRGHAAMPVYRCELCWKTFSDSSNFAKHRKVHNLCAYTCDTCSKKFNRKRSLVDHLKFHEKQKPISCSVEGCAKVFFSQTTYKKHCKLNHGPARFPCQICKKKYDSVKDMWDHKWQVHKMRKIIADCPLCDMQFRKYADVKTHMRTVHHDSSVDLKRLNALSPTEKSGNVAQLACDQVVIVEPETEDDRCLTFESRGGKLVGTFTHKDAQDVEVAAEN